MSKKFILNIFPSLGVLWILDLALSGVRAPSTLLFKLLVAVIFSAGLMLNEYVMKKMSKKSVGLYFVLGTLINFFIIYIATLIPIDLLTVNGGSIGAFGLKIADSADQILTLIFCALILMTVGYVTKWSSGDT